MKKIAIFLAALLFVPLVVNAETFLKLGFMATKGQVEENRFVLYSAEVKLEWLFCKNFGLGIGFRKEVQWFYSGYYFSLYPMYKIPLSKRFFLNSSFGLEYGLASSDYDYYRAVYDESKNTVSQKWIYLIQNAPIPWDALKKGNIGIIYPFGAVSGGISILKWLSVEIGIRIQALRFGVKSCNFPIGDIRDEKNWRVVPSVFIQVGLRLSGKKDKR